MCGIVGTWDFKNKINPEILKKMRDTLKHRGPDDAGFFIDDESNIGLGHRRLSIIDLSERGHQPMKTEDNSLYITYNGETYNFKEIKKELEQKNYSFFSSSDTEVILKAYKEWGIEAIEKFRGMFALGLWDKTKQELILIRDRAGIKPLYYYFSPDKSLFIFASEIKAILAHPQVKKELNFEALRLFLQLSYIPAPHSIFKNIYKLEPGHILTINKTGQIEKTRYWNVNDFYAKQSEYKRKPEQEVIKELEDILTKSFKLRMVADVEVGHFLSGGLDSSLVAAILTKKLGLKIKTFTIGFKDKKLNEAEHAKKIAEYLGTDHHEIYCTEKEAMEVLPKLAEIYDEPFGDSSAIPTYLVSKFARQYVKVSLSADAGDETFCGYDRYWIIDSLFRKFQRVPKFILRIGLFFLNLLPSSVLEFFYKIFGFILPKQVMSKKRIYKLKRKINKLKEVIKNPNDLVSFYQLLGFGYWKEPELSQLINAKEEQTFFKEDSRIEQADNLTRMQAIDYKTYLVDDVLVKVDRAGMAVGLEGRDPLIDHKIIEYAAQLPIDLKYRNGVSKYILRKILYKYVPKKLLERPKQGFTVPLEKWLRGDLKYLLDNYLDKERIKREGIFNPEIVEQEKNKFLEKGVDYAEHLWLLIMFEMWREKWFN